MKILVAACLLSGQLAMAQAVKVDPASMKQLGTVDARYQSYNIEMVEVTGGRFWKSLTDAEYKAIEDGRARSNDPSQAGANPALFAQREPIDLANPKLRKLAAGLAPAYVRVSGGWANNVYYFDSDGPAPEKAPDGYGAVLTRKEWKGVIDFSKAVDASILTSTPVGKGTRDAQGAWMPGQSEKWIAYTKSIGGTIAAAQFMNEPNLAGGSGVKGYDATAFAADLKVWTAMMKRDLPNTKLVGPGNNGEGTPLAKLTAGHAIPTERMLQATGDAWDVFAYHMYPTGSRRCVGGTDLQANPTLGMSAEYLKRTNVAFDFYAPLRDKYAPGKPMWITETAQAACGGDLYGETYADTFRYLYQMGTLAQAGVQVIFHNTLAASDYGLIDEKTLEPRADYWAALMWSRLMGTTVLDAGTTSHDNAYLFAQCTRNHPGKVTVLADNPSDTPLTLQMPAGEAYVLSSTSTDSKAVMLNGVPLIVAANGDLPRTSGKKMKAGEMTVAAKTIVFYVTDSTNAACGR